MEWQIVRSIKQINQKSIPDVFGIRTRDRRRWSMEGTNKSTELFESLLTNTMLHIQASCVLLSASFGWARSLNGSTSSSGDLAQSLESFWVRFDGYSTGHSILSIAYCFFVVFIQLLSQMGSLEGSMLSKNVNWVKILMHNLGAVLW